MIDEPLRLKRLPGRIRRLTATELDLVPPQADPDGSVTTPDVGIDADDPHLLATRELLRFYGGVIFTGPPGTSKSWYAQNIALLLVGGDSDRVRFVQFHPSYQYEDFVEGYVPRKEGGFALRPKHLLEMCAKARKHPDDLVVLVIDELSRGEPGRVFGEALTYVEATKRGLEFHLSSGTQAFIPKNLVFLCTMNPLDRGVDEVDAAFERRFAKIAMEPDPDLLESFLTEAGMDADLREQVRAFFEWVNRPGATAYGGLGHTFFLNISDEGGLRRLWDHQLRFLFEKAFQLDPEGYAEVERRWWEIGTAEASSLTETVMLGEVTDPTGDELGTE